MTEHRQSMPVKLKISTSSSLTDRGGLRNTCFSLLFILSFKGTFWSKQKHISVFRRVYSFYKVMKRGVRLYWENIQDIE